MHRIYSTYHRVNNRSPIQDTVWFTRPEALMKQSRPRPRATDRDTKSNSCLSTRPVRGTQSPLNSCRKGCAGLNAVRPTQTLHAPRGAAAGMARTVVPIHGACAETERNQVEFRILARPGVAISPQSARSPRRAAYPNGRAGGGKPLHLRVRGRSAAAFSLCARLPVPCG